MKNRDNGSLHECMWKGDTVTTAINTSACVNENRDNGGLHETRAQMEATGLTQCFCVRKITELLSCMVCTYILQIEFHFYVIYNN
jgi:hypothetical protein